jgi:integrase
LEYVAALAKVPAGASLLEAVTDYAKRHPSTMPSKSVAEVVAELIAEKESANLSDEHLRDLRKRLTPFAKSFQMPIGSVSAELVRTYLANLHKLGGIPVAPRTKLNFLRCICGLFHFARKRRYVPRDLVDEISEIDLPKPSHVEIGVFTPAQLRDMLAVAESDIVPALAIGAFGGLRTAELARLDWSEVKLGEGVIVVGADKAKTAQRRLVPITDNLAAWLAPHARPDGPVNPSTDDRGLNHRLVRGAAKPAGVTWVKNGLRHSFVSYRLAATHDPARVATEAGNSPAMIHRNYKALVTEAQGNEWFSILPGSKCAEPLTSGACG